MVERWFEGEDTEVSEPVADGGFKNDEVDVAVCSDDSSSMSSEESGCAPLRNVGGQRQNYSSISKKLLSQLRESSRCSV